MASCQEAYRGPANLGRTIGVFVDRMGIPFKDSGCGIQDAGAGQAGCRSSALSPVSCIPHPSMQHTSRGPGIPTVGTYNTSDFRKGLKVQIDGVPYLMVEMNFRK